MRYYVCIYILLYELYINIRYITHIIYIYIFIVYTYMYCKVWITSQVFPLFVQEFERVGDDLILERQGNLCLLGGAEGCWVTESQITPRSFS